jgi:prepilin peptidase CpaA
VGQGLRVKVARAGMSPLESLALTHVFAHPAVVLIFPFAMALAASMDLFTMTIPNRLSLGLTVAYFALAVLIGVPTASILSNLSCGFAVLALAFLFFAFGWVGGGDAKLAAATALWLGWDLLLQYGLLVSIVGGAITVGFLVLRRAPLPMKLGEVAWVARLHDAKAGIPYGLALAIGGLLIYPQSQIFSSLL